MYDENGFNRPNDNRLLRSPSREDSICVQGYREDIPENRVQQEKAKRPTYLEVARVNHIARATDGTDSLGKRFGSVA